MYKIDTRFKSNAFQICTRVRYFRMYVIFGSNNILTHARYNVIPSNQTERRVNITNTYDRTAAAARKRLFIYFRLRANRKYDRFIFGRVPKGGLTLLKCCANNDDY